MEKILYDLLFEQYGGALADEIACGFVSRPVTLRVNRLKAGADEVFEELSRVGAELCPVKWYGDAVIVKNLRESDIREIDLYKDGKIYLQSLSSMLPPLILEPKEGESILDMAAAPGGKTTQIAAMTGGKANVTACEKNKIRAERMRFNLERQGAGRVSVMVCDSRKLDPHFRFDKILLDAPCSGSGTVVPECCDFSMELYERSMKLQRELLTKALGLLRPGSRMVYSTCSVLRGENEDVIGSVKKLARVLPIDISRFEGVPTLPTAAPGTLLVKPTELYEGFFAAALERI